MYAEYANAKQVGEDYRADMECLVGFSSSNAEGICPGTIVSTSILAPMGRFGCVVWNKRLPSCLQSIA